MKRELIALVLISIVFSSFGQWLPTKDDPQARLDFEILRTKDPVTNLLPHNIHQRELRFARLQDENVRRTLGDRLLSSSSWTHRGPFNVGGRTRALAVDISDPSENTILAGGVSGGLWRTVDGGGSWIKSTSSTDLQSISCIAQDPRLGNRHIWYYGTGEFSGNSAGGRGAPYRGDGVFKSIDGGISWDVLSITSTNVPQELDNCFDFNHEIVVNPVNGDLFIANICGIYRSRDGGITFERVLDAISGSSSVHFSDIAVTSAGILYATKNTNGSGIFQSIDGGTTWVNITDQNHSFVLRDRKEIAIVPSNEDIVYVLTNPLDKLKTH